MSHKSEAKYSNITKDRLIYNKTGHFAILDDDDGGGGGGRILINSVLYIKFPCFHLITRGKGVQLRGRGPAFQQCVKQPRHYKKNRKASGLITHFQGRI